MTFYRSAPPPAVPNGIPIRGYRAPDLRLVAVALLLALLCAGCGDTVQERMGRAVSSLEAGHYRKAEIELKNVLQKQPDNGKAWFLLGKMSLATNQYADAAEQFQRAREHGGAADQVDMPLARALLGKSAYRDVLSLLSPDKATGDGDKAAYLVLRGEAYIGLEQPRAAGREFDAALALEHDNIRARIGQARLAEHAGDHGRAARLLDAVLAAHPDDYSALEARGRLAYQRGHCDRAMPQFAHILKLADTAVSPAERFMARAYLSDCQLRAGTYGPAKKNIARLMKAGPDSVYANYLQALVDIHDKTYSQAVVHLQRILKVAPDNTQALTLMGAAQLALDDTALAEAYLNRVLGRQPGNREAAGLLGGLYMRQGKPDKAVEIFQDAVAARQDDPKLHAMLAEALVRAGHTESAVKLAGRGGRDSDPNLTVSVANSMARSGDYDAALALLNQIGDSNTDARIKADVLRVRTYLRQGDADKALDIARRIADERPQDGRLLRLLAGAYLATGANDAAQDTLERALTDNPDDLKTRMAIGLLALRTGDYARAGAQFDRVLSEQPTNLGALLAKAQTAARSDGAAAALPWLEKARAAHPDHAEVGVALSRAYLAAGDSDKALAQAGSLTKTQKDNADIWHLYGVTLLATGDRDAALEKLLKAADMAPDRPGIRLDLARAKLADGQIEAAVGDLNNLRDRFPDFRPALALLALAQYKQGDFDAAMATTDDLAKKPGGAIAADILRGDLWSARTNYAEASQAYARAFKAAPSAKLALSLLHARTRAGIADPDAPARGWLKTHPGDIALGHALAAWYQAQNRWSDAEALYEKLVQRHDEDAVALNNLALLYARRGDPKALAVAERAHGLSPKSAAITDTLGWIAWRNGQHKRGRTLLEQAAQRAPEIPEIQYHLAKVLAHSDATADRQRAHAVLQRLLSSTTPFDSRSEARTLSKTLTESETPNGSS